MGSPAKPLVDRPLTVAFLSAAPGLLGRLISDVGPEQAARALAPGQWSITEVVRHLVEGERDTFLPRLRRMLAETRPVFDKAQPARGDAADLATLAAAFASARAQVVKTLDGLDATGWAREGVSPSRGPLSVETYASSMAAHDTEHLRQLEDVRAALGLRPKRCEARAPLPAAELIAPLETAPARLRMLAAGLDEKQRRRRPARSEWCLNEVMAHLLHVEDRPAFASFSPEPWARERDHSLDRFDASLAAFERARAHTIAFLRGLGPGAGDRLGLSASYGPITLLQYGTHIADHDAEHVAQMAAVRSTLG